MNDPVMPQRHPPDERSKGDEAPPVALSVLRAQQDAATVAARGDAARQDSPLTILYREHIGFVWRDLQRAGLTPAEAEDAAQEVFLVVHRRLPDLDPSRPPRAWLHGIVRRVAADARRKRAREDRRLRLISRPEARELPSEEAVARAEASTWMGEFLDSLDDAARELFVLAEVEGFSRAEIIACTGYTPLVLAVRLRWVRRRFQRFAAAIAARDSGVATSRTMKGEPDSPRDTTKKDET